MGSSKHTPLECKRKVCDLAKWINIVRSKKNCVRRQRRTNLYVEAVLGHAQTSAETEMRQKQTLRRERWQQFQTTIDKGIIKTHSTHNEPVQADLDDATWEVVKSLDNFMTALKMAKPSRAG